MQYIPSADLLIDRKLWLSLELYRVLRTSVTSHIICQFYFPIFRNLLTYSYYAAFASLFKSNLIYSQGLMSMPPKTSRPSAYHF